jgi:hypothetical protein
VGVPVPVVVVAGVFAVLVEPVFVCTETGRSEPVEPAVDVLAADVGVVPPPPPPQPTSARPTAAELEERNRRRLMFNNS